MKVILVSGAFYVKKTRKKYFSGLDYVATQIAREMSKNNETYVFSMTPLGKHAKIENCTVYSFRNRFILKNLGLKNIRPVIKILTYKGKFKEKVKYSRGIFIADYFYNLLKKVQPDLVHINGMGYIYMLCARVAIYLGINVVYTMHGLTYNDPGQTFWQRKIEYMFLEKAVQKGQLVSVISTGIKNKISNEIGESQNIKIITNAPEKAESDSEKESGVFLPIKDRFGISSKDIVICCVGTINNNKNQIQLLQALRELTNEKLKNVKIVFAGQDKTKGKVEKYALKNNLNKKAIFTGFLSREELSNLYDIADFNIVVSHVEGFGMSILEAGLHGVPTIMFKDLAAVDDVYFKEGIILMKNRKNTTIIESIEWAINSKWDRNVISEYVKKHMTNLSKSYNVLYSLGIQQGNLVTFEDASKIIGLGDFNEFN